MLRALNVVSNVERVPLIGLMRPFSQLSGGARRLIHYRMRFEQQQMRRACRARVGAMPLLVALLLAVLQAAVPVAHAMLHVVFRPAAQALQVDAPELKASAAADAPCPLCAADHLPALPQTRLAAVAVASTAAEPENAFCPMQSSAPLDVFCRPPPVR